MSAESPETAIQGALTAIGEGIASLRLAAGQIYPISSRHIFLQAVSQLERTFSEVAGLLDPIDVA